MWRSSALGPGVGRCGTPFIFVHLPSQHRTLAPTRSDDVDNDDDENEDEMEFMVLRMPDIENGIQN